MKLLVQAKAQLNTQLEVLLYVVGLTTGAQHMNTKSVRVYIRMLLKDLSQTKHSKTLFTYVSQHSLIKRIHV